MVEKSNPNYIPISPTLLQKAQASRGYDILNFWIGISFIYAFLTIQKKRSENSVQIFVILEPYKNQ